MAPKSVLIKTPEQIPDVLDIIHDWWFDKDDVVFDQTTATLNIKFRRELTEKRRLLKRKWFWKKVEVPFAESSLKIYHVESYSINDTRQTGFFYRNELEYDQSLKRISISSVGPISLEIIVEVFEVLVEETDRVAEVKTVTSLFS